MNAEQFLHWMAGVLAITPTDATLNAKGLALDTIRAQLAQQLVGQQLGPIPYSTPVQTLVYPPGVRGPGNEQRRAQVANFYDQQTAAAQKRSDLENMQRLSAAGVTFGAIPAPEDERCDARALDALMIDRGYQPQKGQ